MDLALFIAHTLSTFFADLAVELGLIFAIAERSFGYTLGVLAAHAAWKQLTAAWAWCRGRFTRSRHRPES